MEYFDGLRVFRFNHTPKSSQRVDGRLPKYVISYVHSERIYWHPDGCKRAEYDGPVVFFTWPGERWRYGPVGQTWNNRFISWEGPRSETMIRSGLFPQSEPSQAVRKIHDPDVFCHAFDSVLDILDSNPPDSPRVVHALEGLLLRLNEQPTTPLPQTGPAARVRTIIESVQTEPERDWDFAIEAQRASCTSTHFRRLWKRETGRTPIESLQKARIDRAANLLRQNQLSIEQIAWKCGFENPSYFYRLFKAQHKMAPGSYRDAYQRID